MHVLQPKHTKLNSDEAERILAQFNIALAQLPKISNKDMALPEGCNTGDVVKIERKGEFAEVYFRVVI
ncbi:MAG: DNA-directed RNA polymerase subunit RpoH/Rpb5 C-terminal domain-containing protein [Nanoarchaeota archaeon]|nr:DNA-directed RNA polymerase subunit RpoH/Rpb5 C-terminal domain-containing protein [Nanoarchaeota archaeon]